MLKKKRLVTFTVLIMIIMTFFIYNQINVAASYGVEKTYRVLIQTSDDNKVKAKRKYGIRWDFGKKGFTTEVNERAYQELLKNKNLKISKLTKVRLVAKRQDANSKIKRKIIPKDSIPWGVEEIYNSVYIQRTSGGDGIKIAILDTGVNTNHSDILGAAEQCKDFTNNSSPLINGSCNDKNGHGTHVTGTALADGGDDGLGIYGVAPEAELWAYKVINDDGTGYEDDIAMGIRHAADEAERTGSNVIISMSIGSISYSQMIAEAVDYAYQKGLLIVAAAGNNGPGDNTIQYPAALPNVIAVAALENLQENGNFRVSDLSSRGNPSSSGDFIIQERDIEVSAPGIAIESTWYDGSYQIMSGTSMATPHISGLAAKVWSENPSLDNKLLRDEIQTRSKIYDIKGGYGSTIGDDYASGFGFPRVK